MPFRFRRSIRILPGIRLNLGKRSARVSLCVRSARITQHPAHTPPTTLWVRAVLALTLVGVSSITSAQSVPSDNELRTAYCIKIVQEQLAMSRQMVAASESEAAKSAPTSDFLNQLITDARYSIPKLETTLNRLQSYLLPRISQLDPVAVLAAQKRAEADLSALTQASDCFARCTAGLSAKDTEKREACGKSCPVKEIQSRIMACQSPTWLPF